ncbi:MAG: GNAT family N-acetyltransferase, partial [Actinomycetota bacterium]|nr:GNAT family N-acetyltransferase [Actinomycetota bacterium]
MPTLAFTPPALGPRLALRPYRPADLDDVHRFQSDPAVLPFIPWLVRSREESREWLATMADSVVRDEGDHGTWAVERREDGRVVGSVNLTWASERHGQAEFGFVIASDVQRRGYASEASCLLLDAAFAGLGLRRVYARVDSRNHASLHLLRRLGLRQEAHLVQCEHFKGEWTDVIILAVLASEWERR